MVVFLIAVLVGTKHLLRDVDLAGAALSAFPLPRMLVVVVVVDEAVAAAVVVVRIVDLDRAVIDDGAATAVSDGGACCCGGGCCRLRDAMPRVPRSLPSIDDTEPPRDS